MPFPFGNEDTAENSLRDSAGGGTARGEFTTEVQSMKGRKKANKELMIQDENGDPFTKKHDSPQSQRQQKGYMSSLTSKLLGFGSKNKDSSHKKQ